VGRDVVAVDTVLEVLDSATRTPIPRGMVNTIEIMSRSGVRVRERVVRAVRISKGSISI